MPKPEFHLKNTRLIRSSAGPELTATKGPFKNQYPQGRIQSGWRSYQCYRNWERLKNVPAIFVGANFEGKTPLSTEGALYLAKMLLDSAVYTKNIKWFILPLPNPDATSGYFSKVKWERTVNDLAVNDDKDDQINEDGPDDLNGDGLITQMRVEDPEGEYLISGKDPRLMIKADPSKGERGKYKLYPEGIDNDGDGEINEDGPGGINAVSIFRIFLKPTGKRPVYGLEKRPKCSAS